MEEMKVEQQEDQRRRLRNLIFWPRPVEGQFMAVQRGV